MGVILRTLSAFTVMGTLCILISNHALASQDVAGDYVSHFKGKQTGKVRIEQISNRQIRFEIFAEGPGGSSCGMGEYEKRFASLKGNIAIYKNADDENAMAEGERPGYELVFKFDKDKLVLTESNNYELTSQYCGIRANGSIGGSYTRQNGNTNAASVQLDDLFLKSETGNSSVYLPVEQLVETIKKVKLSNGAHPKIVGWQRKGNVYTFTFIADMKIDLKFEHLLNRGGAWSSVSAFANGTPTDPIGLIMQVLAMPRDKTKFDIASEQNQLERDQEEKMRKAEKENAIEQDKMKDAERAAIIRAARDEEISTQQTGPALKIESSNIGTKEVKGESLFNEAFSNLEIQKHTNEVLCKVFSKYPQAAYKYELGKLEIVSTDQTTSVAKIKIPIVIKFDESYIKEFERALSTVSEAKLSNTPLYNLMIKDNVYITNKYYICTSSLSLANQGLSGQCFRFDRSAIKEALKFDGSLISHMPGDSGDYSMQLAFYDIDGNIIQTRNIVLDFDYSYTNIKNFNGLDFDRFLLDKTGMTLAEVKGSFASMGYQPPNVLDSQAILLFIKDGYMPLNVIVELNIANLNKISAVKVSMDSYRQQTSCKPEDL